MDEKLRESEDMNDHYNFDSRFSYGKLLPDFSPDVVKNEPMFFNCSPDFAYEHGGPITRAFFDALEGEAPIVFDSRVHMLMPGWYPAIPGFHHDDVPRNLDTGQPDYDAPTYHSKHAMALINGDIAPTEFAIGRHTLPRISADAGPIYKFWHDEVERQLHEVVDPYGMDGLGTRLVRVPVLTNRIVYFDWQSMHQGTKAVGNGWRWFGRASYQTDRKVTNEIRRQVQVYLENPMEGW